MQQEESQAHTDFTVTRCTCAFCGSFVIVAVRRRPDQASNQSAGVSATTCAITYLSRTSLGPPGVPPASLITLWYFSDTSLVPLWYFSSATCPLPFLFHVFALGPCIVSDAMKTFGSTASFVVLICANYGSKIYEWEDLKNPAFPYSSLEVNFCMHNIDIDI